MKKQNLLVKAGRYYTFKSTLLLTLGWTCLIFISLFYNLHHYKQGQIAILVNVARANVLKDYMYKTWLGSLGGAYVSSDLMPEHYKRIENVDSNTLTTDSGKTLTYINPAIMLNQVRDQTPSKNVFFSNIKTLNSMLPENKPTPWEREILSNQLKNGGEYYSISKNYNVNKIKFIMAIKADAACLKSWPQSDIKLNDVIGGMSVSLPLDYFKKEYSQTSRLFLGHTVFWLLGVFGILFSMRLFIREQGAKIRAERDKEEYRQQNELLLNAAGEGIFGIDTSGNHIFVNPATAAMLGYKVSDLLGRNSHSLLHHTRADGSPYIEHDCPIYKAFKHGKVYQDDSDVFWKKDGTCFPVQYKCRPVVKGGMVHGAVVTFSDISERKKSEELIIESEKRFRATFDLAAVGMAQIELNGNYISGNSKLCNMIGYSQGELVKISF